MRGIELQCTKWAVRESLNFVNRIIGLNMHDSLVSEVPLLPFIFHHNFIKHRLLAAILVFYIFIVYIDGLNGGKPDVTIPNATHGCLKLCAIPVPCASKVDHLFPSLEQQIAS